VTTDASRSSPESASDPSIATEPVCQAAALFSTNSSSAAATLANAAFTVRRALSVMDTAGFRPALGRPHEEAALVHSKLTVAPEFDPIRHEPQADQRGGRGTGPPSNRAVTSA
jgi:predicted NAD/FAD-dependent oxidoreductase